MPRWSNIRVIFRREVRDQLRDRRTLFMIFVLPMLLYPIMGIGIIQFAQALTVKPRTVVLVGPEYLPAEPPLLNKAQNRFLASIFDTADEADRLVVTLKPAKGSWLDPAFRKQITRSRGADAVIVLPADLRKQIERIESPLIDIDYDSADEPSQITYLRVKEVLARWQKNIISLRLKQDKLPETYTEPIKIKPVDVATDAELGSSVWAKLFPFLLVMMSLTGAFYPAVDLCAGEKERGTMETLLISPASRAEIVLGKFLTVFMASVMTALLNLASMGLTGVGIAHRFGSALGRATAPGKRITTVFAAPSFESAFWIVLLLIPLAAFFSAICLALAVLARSMKEGQYYMTPLYLIAIPLIFLTLAPGIEINLFYSLVPITGVSLLLRALILSDYAVAWRFFLPVLLPTIGYGAIALRWAIDQFQREDVLFREAEHVNIRFWIRHLLRDKEPTPNGAEALFCFALMLTFSWFMTQYLIGVGAESTTSALAASQVAFILTPPLAMAVLLTSSPRRTLRLYWPEARFLGLAVGLVLALNPLINELRPIVEWLFPMSRELKTALEQLMKTIPDLPTALLLFAVIPAICEELAFRGFILTGLERGHRARSAIVMSALLFGFMHVLLSLFQQLFNAVLLGLVLGLLAVRSKSIVPGVVFHMINNGLAVLTGAWIATTAGKRFAPWIYRNPGQGLYHWGLVFLGLLVSVILLRLLYRSGERNEAAVPIEPDPALVARSG
jgi:sodium transport system permease protein